MKDILERPYCIFSRANDDFKRSFRLSDDGSIEDIGTAGHDNERFWTYDNGILHLLSNNKQITSSFYLKNRDELQSVFEGYFMNKTPLKMVCFKNRSDLFPLKTKLNNHELVKAGYLEVGEHTYGRINFIDKEFSKLIIGDYCSITEDVVFIGANHRTDMVSTYPFKDLKAYWSCEEIKEHDHVSKGPIIVGNDVWIGHGAKIMTGVHIGDGAVIAAGAVVTKNIEPYSIVGGNPAKHIKFRIQDESERKKMQEISWWNWNEYKIIENINKIMSPDIKKFIDEFYPRNDLQ